MPVPEPDTEPLLRGGGWLVKRPRVKVMLRGREDGVLPCSRSCWSYHGSSSSVTNSSIPPAGFSMGDHPLSPPGPGASAETSRSVRNKRAPASPGRSSPARSCSLQPGGSRLCVRLLASSSRCGSSVTRTALPLIPTAPGAGPSFRVLAPVVPVAAAAEDPSDVAAAVMRRRFLSPRYQLHARDAFRCRS